MHTIILHGGSVEQPELEAIHTMLLELFNGHSTIDTLRLSEMSIHSCTGCFNCWLKSPGECCIADDGRLVARAVVQSDVQIFLTPVTFGGYGGLLKTVVDRLVPTISPLFLKVDGEMHHRLRYPNPGRILVIGWQQKANADSAEIFANLVQRNAINMHAPAYGSVVFSPETSVAEQHELMLNALRQMEVLA